MGIYGLMPPALHSFITESKKSAAAQHVTEHRAAAAAADQAEQSVEVPRFMVSVQD